MNFKTSEYFDKNVKKLAKKYKNIKFDLKEFIKNFNLNHQSATTIKANIYKARVKNSDKLKGKSGGYRIYYYLIIDEVVYFLTIYNKSEIDMINEDILGKIIDNEGL